jgi:two-component system, sensor histidine kinase and response regulator
MDALNEYRPCRSAPTRYDRAPLESRSSAPAISTILVVDDNAQNRALCEATLEDEGYRVIQAEHGEAGVTAFAAEAPDCVLLDVRMPGMDGFAACTRIRALPGGAETPILFLTALRDVDTFDSALRAGGDDFLTKPTRPAELIARVGAALKLRKMSAEIHEYYDVVRRQRDDLMRLQLQKERLSAFLVHDLKNPVNAMDLHAQMLLRNAELPASAVESVQQIRAGARSLTRMVLNLLDISKSEEGKLSARLSDVDAAALVSEVLEELKLRAEGTGVRLHANVDLRRFRSDSDLLRRVLENLVENAIRHAPAGSEVQLRAGVVDGEAEFRVTDMGAGIAPEQREKIFEPFVQLEHGERLVTRAGRGLGLSFCRLAVTALGGRIWVEDACPGAVFCVRLPHG